ncbi:DUF1028 domain-containing protein [Parafrankia soli]|uniref:DUF1028 domain-containing protein n=1 Tax=Parafrankia soli TaxID=2599596 RepID=UPI003B588681
MARDPETGRLGVATASRVLAVGAGVPHLRPGAAYDASATQPFPSRLVAALAAAHPPWRPTSSVRCAALRRSLRRGCGRYPLPGAGVDLEPGLTGGSTVPVRSTGSRSG